MREVLRFKAEHNLARMGLLDDPVFRPVADVAAWRERLGRPGNRAVYEEFDRRHDRYRRANEALVGEAALEPGQRVLDVGAGPRRDGAGRVGRCPGLDVLCVEPAAAMRERGRAIRGRALDGDAAGASASTACSAAPRSGCSARSARRSRGWPRWSRPAAHLRSRSRRSTSASRTSPAAERDPLLLELPARLADGRVPRAPAGELIPDPAPLLRDAGLGPRAWSFEVRLTQAGAPRLAEDPAAHGRPAR